MRIITFSSYNAHTDQIFSDLKILKFVNINKYLVSILMYKVKYALIPDVISTMFSFISNTHSHNTRQQQNYYIALSRTKLSQFSITFHGPKQWNCLPSHIQNSSSIYSLKRHLCILLL